MLTSQSRMIDEMIARYENEAKEACDKITTKEERFYHNGRMAGKAEVYREVIEDLKKLKEM